MGEDGGRMGKGVRNAGAGGEGGSVLMRGFTVRLYRTPPRTPGRLRRAPRGNALALFPALFCGVREKDLPHRRSF